MSVYDGVAEMWRHDMLRSRKKRRIDPTGNHGRPNSQTQGPSTDLSPKVNKVMGSNLFLKVYVPALFSSY
jgi:hypothetical protein